MIRRQLVPAILMLALFTVGLGLVYPLVVTGIAQVATSNKADGSMVEVDGKAVGSSLIGQNFDDPQYFHPRPSAAGDGYDALSSGGSNLGPSNPELSAAVSERAEAYRSDNNLGVDVTIPVDAVTSSGSGLDPHISIANARLQTARVASVRGLPESEVAELVDANTDGRTFGFLGQKGVNVLRLNVALDAGSGKG